jgi:endonuclease/exonuclease/phosphatase family metal-dependent hydrolase
MSLLLVLLLLFLGCGRHGCCEAAPRSVRVVTFNIHAWRTAGHEDNLDQLVDLLADLKPDVVCLNEVLHPFAAPAPDDPYWQTVKEGHGYGLACPPGSQPSKVGSTHLGRLADKLGLPHVAFGSATEEGSFCGRFPFGNAILSRYELADVRHERLRVIMPDDLTLGGQSRTMDDLQDRACTSARVVLRTPRDTNPREDARLGADAATDEATAEEEEQQQQRELGIAVAHLDHKAEELRERQIREVITHCEESAFADGLPYLLMGDFNSFDKADMSDEGWAHICALYASRGWPPPREDSLVQRAVRSAGLADAHALAPPDKAPWPPPPTSWTDTRIDYMLLSASAQRAPNRLRVANHRTVASCRASDHLPIVCDLELT